MKKEDFERKEYLKNFKNISEATASRDLNWIVLERILSKTGDKRNTKHHFIN